ncbi:O-antigen ligase family protein [Danxiaibacter flavus]|uniref:O-antigen ligase family protein n=1 Tax=Danxiaibacter flavus TaxID=3049108 RepID=A0ABV3ZEL4_9BACT|nr:O-antigen ligase family protein [Chitinophagaceae bacterium DXS]
MKGILLYRNKPGRSILVLTLLLLTVVGLSYVIASQGVIGGGLITAGLIGAAFVVCAFNNPYFGFYITTIVSFFLFFIQRMLFIDGNAFLVDGLIYITFVGVLFQKYFKKDALWETRTHKISILLLLYFVFILLEFLNPNAHSLAGNMVYTRDFMRQLLTYFITFNLFSSYKSIRNYFILWMVLMAICGAYGCFQQWHGLSANELRSILIDDMTAQLYRLADGGWRKFSTFADPTTFGISSAVTALFILVKMLKQKDIRLKALYFVTVVILLLAMTYTGTRTATFLFIAGVCLYVLMTMNDKRTLLFFCIAAMIFAVLIFGPFYGSTSLNRLRSAFNKEDVSLNVRDVNRARIQPYIYSHPFGGGLTVTNAIGAKYNPGHPLANFPPDSGLLKYALETGPIGLLFIVIIYFVVLQTGISTYFRTNDQTAKRMLLPLIVAVFGFMVAQYSQVAINQIPGVFFFCGAFAAIARIAQRANDYDNSLKT